MQMRRRGAGMLGTAAAALWLALPSAAPAQTPAPPATPGAVERSADLRGVRLRAGQSLAFALHPNEVPIALTARSDTPLQVCPSTLDGAGPESGDSSWPSPTGFLKCIPFDRSVQLPSTQSGLYHLAFLVRAADGRAATIPRLTITYVPGDGYFEVLPPPVAPGARAPRISVTPTAAHTIGAGATGLLDVVAAPGVRTSVTQRGRRVPATSARPPSGESPAFGPVRLHVRVRVVTTNHGTAAASIRIAVAWDSRFVSS